MKPTICVPLGALLLATCLTAAQPAFAQLVCKADTTEAVATKLADQTNPIRPSSGR